MTILPIVSADGKVSIDECFFRNNSMIDIGYSSQVANISNSFFFDGVVVGFGAGLIETTNTSFYNSKIRAPILNRLISRQSTFVSSELIFDKAIIDSSMFVNSTLHLSKTRQHFYTNQYSTVYQPERSIISNTVFNNTSISFNSSRVMLKNSQLYSSMVC